MGYDFPSIQSCFFQFINEIYHCCRNMNHIFRKKEIIQKQKAYYTGYLVFTWKRTIKWYKELCNYVKYVQSFSYALLRITITNTYIILLQQQWQNNNKL